MKRTIRLRESELRNMITESVKRVLRESDFDEFEDDNASYDLSEYDDIKKHDFPMFNKWR